MREKFSDKYDKSTMGMDEYDAVAKDYKTYADWNEGGYVIKKGEKSQYVTDDNIALFHRTQVKKKIDYVQRSIQRSFIRSFNAHNGEYDNDDYEILY